MKQTGSNKKNSRLYSVLWGCFCALWVGVILFFSMLSAGCLGPMPSFEELENPQSMQASEVISCDGQVLGYIGLQNRSDVRYEDISENVINALIATEDVRFYSHSGIDTRSLGRVLFKTLIGRHSSSGGGSTITQQLARTSSLAKRKASWVP